MKIGAAIGWVSLTTLLARQVAGQLPNLNDIFSQSKDRKSIDVNLGNLIDKIDDIIDSKEFKDGLEKVEEAFEKIKPELQEWLEENWNSKWVDGSGDRWDSRNKLQGWNIDEVVKEFDHFFEENDAAIIAKNHADSDKFQLELQQTLSLFNRGIESGKVTDVEYVADEDTRFQKLYDLALISAERSKQLNRDQLLDSQPSLQAEKESSGVTSGNKVPEEIMSRFELIIITCLITSLITFVITILVCRWRRSRKPSSPALRDEEAVQSSELQHIGAAQFVPVVDDSNKVTRQTSQASSAHSMQAVRF